jgi:hypothetical protein
MNYVERQRFNLLDPQTNADAAQIKLAQKLAGNKKWAHAHWFASPNGFFAKGTPGEVEA